MTAGKRRRTAPEPDKQAETLPPEVLDAALEQLAQEAAAAEAEAVEAASRFVTGGRRCCQ